MDSSLERKLNEESLTKPLNEVFEIVCKIGKGSYGNVFKALHKETGSIVAIKQVPVDCDLHEIIKEISIMQQCDSPFIVKYYGSYIEHSNLYIIMEYCGAGSVLDLMKLRGKTLNENEISIILQYTLKGLEYLHLKRKIHRDIKAGNILLTKNGNAKLADFGVASQLSDTMSKRNTVIGSPFWMAPEIIQEIGYDCLADIWSIGITAIELAEGKPPYADIHPMRAIFMIPTKPPPSLSYPHKWSNDFIDFVSKCLVKNPQQRATASELLQHNFIKNAKSINILKNMIDEALDIRENILNTNIEDETSDESTIRNDSDRTLIRKKSITDTITESLQNTMIINEDEEGEDEECFDTIKINATTSKTSTSTLITHKSDNDIDIKDKTLKRPQFMQHFDEQRDLITKLKQEIKEFERDKTINATNLNRQDIQSRLKIVDQEMEKEIEQLRRKYEIKRKPILDAIELKKKQHQIF